MRILSRSSRKCTVTGTDSHELHGLDVVSCAALVETNHGTVNLIMNEYACYGKGHPIHSSGWIEWFKNSVDDRSVQVMVNRGSVPLMAMPCPSFAEVALLKNSCSLFLLISSFQRSLTLLAHFVSFLMIACLHVSFTAYENFYKLSENAMSSCLLSTFSPSEVSEIRNSTIKHISTYALVHSSICIIYPIFSFLMNN